MVQTLVWHHRCMAQLGMAQTFVLHHRCTAQVLKPWLKHICKFAVICAHPTETRLNSADQPMSFFTSTASSFFHSTKFASSDCKAISSFLPSDSNSMVLTEPDGTLTTSSL